MILGGDKSKFEIQHVFAFSVPIYVQDGNKIELINLNPFEVPETHYTPKRNRNFMSF